MRIDSEHKLSFFQNLYEDAKGKLGDLIDDLIKWKEQYGGDLKIDGSNTEATVCRNITYELLESQLSSYIPPASVSPEVWSERNERNAKSIEKLLSNIRNKLPFEKMNDIDERYAVIYGASVWLVEWDNSIMTHNTVGDVKINVFSPSHFVGQPEIFDIPEMEYCFITLDTTKEDLVRKYDVSFDEADETEREDGSDDSTATVVICYYKDENDGICQYIWSGDVELSDVEDYYSRKRYICKKCGKRKELCTCDKPVYEMENEEYEALDHDIQLTDGQVLSASCPVIKDGQVVMEKVQRQAILEDGTVAMDDVNGVLVPAMIEVEVPKMEQTKLPYFVPTKFPIVIRKNTSQEDCLLGQSDCQFIRHQQQEINKLESRIQKKLLRSGVYPTAPEDYAGQFDEGLYEDVIKVRQNDFKLFSRIDLQCNIAQDIAQSDRIYDQAKRILGITDSYQGQYDSSAQSGVAKKMQIQQAAGRLDSKRRMKNAAYAEIDEIIFQLYLAFADEPRIVSFKDAQGRLQNAKFNRYDFIERDDAGEFYYNSQYLFATDGTGDIENNRTAIWEENKALFQSGAYGDPTQLETQLIFWQNMERMHYPFARDNVERITSVIEAQRAAMEQQLAAQQQDIQQAEQLVSKMELATDNSTNYLDYIKNFGGKK